MLTPHLFFSEIPVHVAFIGCRNAEGPLDPEGGSLGKDLWGSSRRQQGLPGPGHHPTDPKPLRPLGDRVLPPKRGKVSPGV